MRPVPGQQAVAALLAHLATLGQQVRLEQPVGAVVEAPVAVAPREAEDPRLGEGLHHGAHLARRTPAPVDRLAGPKSRVLSGPSASMRSSTSATTSG